jgi:hypothetical protein
MNRNRFFWPLPALLLIIFAGDRILNGPYASDQYKRMAEQFRSLNAPPHSRLLKRLDSFSEWNPHKATVGAAYATSLSEAEVRTYYEHELQSHGWRLQSEQSERAAYCKGNFAASLRFGSGNIPDGATYVLAIDRGTCR